MIFEMAVADAYAIPFEFVDRDKYPGENDLKTYHQHPEYDGLKPSQYTDDTLRTKATARLLSRGGSDKWFTPHEYIASLQYEFEQDPRDGFSRRFQRFLEDNRTTPASTMMRQIDRKHSNGSIMGCLPCGFLEEPREVMLAAMMQAVSTHSFKTVPYAQALALAAHHLVRGEELATIPDFIEHWMDHTVIDQTIYRPIGEKVARCSMGARGTTRQVFRLLYEHESLSEMLSAAVEAGGDTDSMAALAVGLGSLTSEIQNDLPAPLVEQLEFTDARKQTDLMFYEERLRQAHGLPTEPAFIYQIGSRVC